MRPCRPILSIVAALLAAAWLEQPSPAGIVDGERWLGSLEWRWIGGFFRNYLPRLVARGLLSGEEVTMRKRELGISRKVRVFSLAVGIAVVLIDLLAIEILRSRAAEGSSPEARMVKGIYEQNPTPPLEMD